MATGRVFFDSLPLSFDLQAFIDSSPNIEAVQRTSRQRAISKGDIYFEAFIRKHVIKDGKPLLIDGYFDVIDPNTFSTAFLHRNHGHELKFARDLTIQRDVPTTFNSYLHQLERLAKDCRTQLDVAASHQHQRLYLKDIGCPAAWWDNIRAILPLMLRQMKDVTPQNKSGTDLATRSANLMSLIPPIKRSQTAICYIGHEGTYTPARQMSRASIGVNIMVEGSEPNDNDGTAREGNSIWFMTKTEDKDTVAQYFRDTLQYDIEREDLFIDLQTWQRAPFQVYVMEQQPGDLVLLPPHAPYQVYNRGTRTMKVAWAINVPGCHSCASSSQPDRLARCTACNHQWCNMCLEECFSTMPVMQEPPWHCPNCKPSGLADQHPGLLDSQSHGLQGLVQSHDGHDISEELSCPSSPPNATPSAELFVPDSLAATLDELGSDHTAFQTAPVRRRSSSRQRAAYACASDDYVDEPSDDSDVSSSPLSPDSIAVRQEAKTLEGKAATRQRRASTARSDTRTLRQAQGTGTSQSSLIASQHLALRTKAVDSTRTDSVPSERQDLGDSSCETFKGFSPPRPPVYTAPSMSTKRKRPMTFDGLSSAPTKKRKSSVGLETSRDLLRKQVPAMRVLYQDTIMPFLQELNKAAEAKGKVAVISVGFRDNVTGELARTVEVDQPPEELVQGHSSPPLEAAFPPSRRTEQIPQRPSIAEALKAMSATSTRKQSFGSKSFTMSRPSNDAQSEEVDNTRNGQIVSDGSAIQFLADVSGNTSRHETPHANAMSRI